VNHKRVEKIWRREGLKVPKKQPERSRLWLNDGSCIRLRPEHKDHVWSYDFMVDRTTDGRAFKILNIIDEFTRECLAILVARKIKTQGITCGYFIACLNASATEDTAYSLTCGFSQQMETNFPPAGA